MATPEDGYELDAWSGCAADGSLTVYEAVTVTCTFKIKTFFVTFVDWDDAVLKTAQKVTWGEAAVPPADPTREGYTFIGWSKSLTNITADLSVAAQYEKNSATAIGEMETDPAPHTLTPRKFFRNGTLYIEYNGTIYITQGQEL